MNVIYLENHRRFRQNFTPEPRRGWFVPAFLMSAYVVFMTCIALQWFGVLR